MTLSFKTEINGRPTFFVEKIVNALSRNNLISCSELDDVIDKYYDYYTSIKTGIDEEFIFPEFSKNFDKLKIHTIRLDKGDRWRAGNKIHFVINNRTPNRFQFAPIVECVGIQHIIISQNIEKKWVAISDTPKWGINDVLNEKEIETLAINDGFESVEAFWQYFDQPFQGKIIHWTKLKY